MNAQSRYAAAMLAEYAALDAHVEAFRKGDLLGANEARAKIVCAQEERRASSATQDQPEHGWRW